MRVSCLPFVVRAHLYERSQAGRVRDLVVHERLELLRGGGVRCDLLERVAHDAVRAVACACDAIRRISSKQELQRNG